MTKKDKANFAYFIFIQSLALTLVFLLGACSTTNKSIGLGGSIGAGAGAIAGGLSNPARDGQYRTRNVIIGTALGGMAGMLAGSVIHNEVEDQKRDAFLKGKASAPSPKAGAMPSLKTAKVESRWVDGHSTGNRYIEGHFEYLIVEPARWDENQ